ncbi:hypothetical protein [Inquilinus sp. OTU3971]|uniref:hypothetical protein n=1 Tax=Inquilinus sp. OTU3971 TaxID=3043855 RepID=UPI00313B33BA
MKKFSIAISIEAHRKLREHAARFGLGNNDILTIMLETVPASAFEARARAVAEERQGGAVLDQISKQAKALTPAQREQLLKVLQGEK